MDLVKLMQKVEYRCYQCMIVESILISEFEKSFEYMACGKCGGESKGIGIASIVPAHKVDFAEIRLKDGKNSSALQY